jgi:predicted regulator of Ras-like GTPase activity (Roadblock/LC7/MglB family)
MSPPPFRQPSIEAESTSSNWVFDDTKKNIMKEALEELNAVEGISKGFWVGPDGRILFASQETDYQSEASKQAVSFQQNTRQAVEALQQGKLQQMMVTADNGHILMVCFNGPTLVVLANGKTNLGLLRFSLDSMVKKLEKTI